MARLLGFVFLFIVIARTAHAGFFVDEDGAPSPARNERNGQQLMQTPPVVQSQGGLVGAIRPQAERTEWIGEEGKSLKAVFLSWAARAGWTLDWQVVDGDDDIDYLVPSGLKASGTFDQAVVQICRLYLKAEVPLKADVSISQRYIRIIAAGNQK